MTYRESQYGIAHGAVPAGVRGARGGPGAARVLDRLYEVVRRHDEEAWLAGGMIRTESVAGDG